MTVGLEALGTAAELLVYRCVEVFLSTIGRSEIRYVPMRITSSFLYLHFKINIINARGFKKKILFYQYELIKRKLSLALF